MSGFFEMLALAAVMGLAIFVSLPIVLRRSRTARVTNLLSAAAIGILVFIVADLWGNVAGLLYASGSFVSNVDLDVVFGAGVLGAFLALLLVEYTPEGRTELSPTSTALVVALAIGFQNLTEGMVFGAAWAASALGLLTVVFAGFFVQNVTEGFPIAGPLLRSDERRVGLFSAYFALGGIPVVVGAGVGYYWTSTPLVVAFDALAIGTCLYAILPMLRAAFRPAETPDATRLKLRLTYLGIGLGFVLGFVVNSF